MNYDPLRPTPQWGCPRCPAVFTSPNARLNHLETVHSEPVDTTGAAAAQASLQRVLERTAARFALLMAKREVQHGK